MFRLFRRPRPSTPIIRSARLCLEGLELRAAPSGLDSPLLDEPASGDSTVPVVSDEGGKTIQDQGAEETSQPAELAPSVEGPSADDPFVDSSPTFAVQGDAGTAGVSPGDPTAQFAFPPLPPAPVITDFYCSEGADYVFTFQGTVDGYLPGMVVYFGGEPESLQGQSAEVDEYGNFRLVIQLSGTTSDEGTATAVASDTFAQQSEEAWTSVHQTGVG